jgi:hypothetical protein
MSIAPATAAPASEAAPDTEATRPVPAHRRSLLGRVAGGDLHTAAADTRDHAGDAVADQVGAQEDALVRATDGFAGTATATDELEADLYQAELEIAIDDLDQQAGDFRAQGADVQ